MEVKKSLIKLIDLSEEKIEILKNILEYSKSVDLSGDDENFTVATDIVEKRQKLILKMMEIDNDYMKNFEDVKRSLGIDDITDIDKIKYPKIVDLYEKTYEIMALLKDIKELDEKNISSIKSRTSEMNNKLNVNNNMNKINKSYGKKYAGIDSYVFDKKR